MDQCSSVYAVRIKVTAAHFVLPQSLTNIRTFSPASQDQCSCSLGRPIKKGFRASKLAGTLFYCAAFILQVHLGPSDKVVLGIFEHFHEVCGEAGYTDYKVLVVFRMLLRIL